MSTRPAPGGPSLDDGTVVSRVAPLVRKLAIPLVLLVALSAGGLAMCGLPGDTLDDGEGIVGTYVVNGVDPVGVEYSGTVNITTSADGYLVEWIVTGSIQSGTGVLDGDVLTVDWSTVTDARGATSTGTARYVVGDDGVLRGERFVDGVAEAGSEEIFPEP